MLTELRLRAPLSLHGVALSIGGAGAALPRASRAPEALIDRYEPALFSEHLAWSTHDGVYLNDLLPLSLQRRRRLTASSDHIDEVQADASAADAARESLDLCRLRENSTMSEIEFLREIVDRTGCGLLLDVNNVYVSARQSRHEPSGLSRPVPHASMSARSISAAMSSDRRRLGAPLLIDAHGTPVADVVWAALRSARSRASARCRR